MRQIPKNSSAWRASVLASRNRAVSIKTCCQPAIKPGVIVRLARTLALQFALVVCLALAGCREQSAPQALEPGMFVGENPKLISEMEADEVIVAINGAALTRRRYDQLLAMAEAMYTLNKPRASGVELAAYRRERSLSMINDFAVKQLLLQEARRRKLTPTEEARAFAEALIVRLAAGQNKTLSQLYASMGESGTLLKAMVEEDALVHALRIDEHGDRLRVTEADVDEKLAWYAAYNEKCIATNALIMARGKMISGWARAGEDFAELAGRFSEVNDGSGNEWGNFYPHEIDDPQVRKAALELPVGGISDPFDTEEGLIIIKVLEREGAGEESVLNANPLSVRLARILLRLTAGGEGWKLPEREAVRKELERQRLVEVQRELLSGLRAAARVEYPHGTNLWPQVKSRR